MEGSRPSVPCSSGPLGCVLTAVALPLFFFETATPRVVGAVFLDPSKSPTRGAERRDKKGGQPLPACLLVASGTGSGLAARGALFLPWRAAAAFGPRSSGASTTT